jgi:peptidyl-prolyl cis-trans isomerase B (cyclophilin B)
VFGKVVEGLDVVDSVAGGDALTSVKIEGDTAAVLAAKAERVAEWNKYLSPLGIRVACGRASAPTL